MSAYSLICPATANAVRLADLSMTDESTDPDYSLGYHHDPAITTRANGLTTEVTVTLDNPDTIIAAAVINHNASEIRVKNSDSTLNQVITNPGNDFENAPQWGWANVEGLPGTTDTVFKFAFTKTGTNVIEFGTLWLVTAWTLANFLYGIKWGHKRPGHITKRTKLGHRTEWFGGMKVQTVTGEVNQKDDLANWLIMEAEASGIGYPMLFIPYRDQNRAMQLTFVDFTQFSYTHDEQKQIGLQVDFEELSTGDRPRTT